jgi:hypothetical protein
MKIVLFCFVTLISIKLISQTEFTTQNFDLETIGKPKGWGFYTGYKNKNGNIVIRVGQITCDLTKPSSNATKNDYKGLNWKFEDLEFDENLIYVKSEKKEFPSTIEAINHEPVWGNKFATLTTLGIAEPLTNDYIGKSTVIPTFDMGAKLTSGYIVGKSSNGINRGTYGNSSVGCSELPDFKQITTGIPKAGKGEVWTGIKGFPIIGGGVALYHVGGTYKEQSLLHYVLNEYNDKLDVVKTVQIDCDYNSMAQIVNVKVGENLWDYVIILQTSDKMVPDSIQVKPADYAEIIYVDGKTFEIQYRTETDLPFTNWFVRNAEVGQEGSVYLFGPAGKNNKNYMPAMGGFCQISDDDLGSKSLKNHPKNLPNYQIARLKDGRVFNITGTDIETANSKINILKGVNTKFNARPSFNVSSLSFYSPWDQNKVFKDPVKYYFKNSKIIVCMQPFHDRTSTRSFDHGGMVTAIFDPNGVLESYIVKPEKNYSNMDEFFSKDGKTMYVAYYEIESLNNKVFDGSYTPKKISNFIAANLQFTKIDLNNNKVEVVDEIGLNQFAVNANNPVLADTPNEIIFLGKELNKPSKDCEILMINVKK